MSDSDSSDRGDQAPAGDGAPGGVGPSAEELLILLEAASRLSPDKIRILLEAIRGAIEH